MEPFEIVDHTADVGIVAHGATLPELFANAAAGLATIVTDRDRVEERASRRLRVEAEDRAGLLAALLSELLFLLEVERFVTRRIEVESVSDIEAVATAFGEPICDRHEFLAEVKAVTHHDLSVERDGDAWRATVLFDV